MASIFIEEEIDSALYLLDKETLKEEDKGPFKKYVTGLGGRGSSKIVTKSDKGEGVKQNSDVTAY